jgi:hypothetical protein
MLNGVAFRGIRCLLFVGLVALSGQVVASEEVAEDSSKGIFKTIGDDYVSFYSPDRLLRMGIGFGVGAIIANTPADQEVQNWYQDHIRDNTTDDISVRAKNLGEGKYLIPLAFLAAGTTYIDEDQIVGDWGRHTARAYLVGAPAMLLMQNVTGGSRPGETDGDDSGWDPFNDVNGVSGHSFMGAVPFLVVARMSEDNIWVKSLAYVTSTAAAWSRLNDDDHYLSQIALGWYMAWESVDAAYDADAKDETVAIKPFIMGDSYGMALAVKW